MRFRVSDGCLHAEKFSEGAFPDDSMVVVDNPFYLGENLILLLLEPEIISHVRGSVLANAHRFQKIYTHDQAILDAEPQRAVLLNFCYTTFHPEEIKLFDVSKKEYAVSSWAATKIFPGVPGHALRAQVHFNQHLFPKNFTFFRSHRPWPADQLLPDLGGNPFFHDTKVPLFEKFQFAVTIENCQASNWFSEKLIDCLLAKCIPLYFGCTNISDYFDTSGWILFSSGQELLTKTQTLTPDYYASYKTTIEKNFITALEYRDVYANIERCALNHSTVDAIPSSRPI